VVLYCPGPVVLGSRPTDLGKMVQEPRARFHVAKWGGFVIKTGYKVALPTLSKFNLTEPAKKVVQLALSAFLKLSRAAELWM
jgi:hypothetical protein